MLGWQENTLNILILEFYEEFDNLVNSFILQVCDKAFVTALPPPCNNLAHNTRLCQGVTRCIVATL